MLYRCVRFGPKVKAVSNKVELARQDLSILEQSFYRSDVLSPPKRLDISADSSGLAVLPEREVVIEPSINSPIQALENINKIILCNSTI